MRFLKVSSTRNVFPTLLLPYKATNSALPLSYSSFSFSISFSLPMIISKPLMTDCAIFFFLTNLSLFQEKYNTLSGLHLSKSCYIFLSAPRFVIFVADTGMDIRVADIDYLHRMSGLRGGTPSSPHVHASPQGMDHSLFLSTSAGVTLSILRTSSALITKYMPMITAKSPT